MLPHRTVALVASVVAALGAGAVASSAQTPDETAIVAPAASPIDATLAAECATTAEHPGRRDADDLSEGRRHPGASPRCSAI